jgi:hypothetical protein
LKHARALGCKDCEAGSNAAQALNRIQDRDTKLNSVEDLCAIIDDLPDFGIPVFLVL